MTRTASGVPASGMRDCSAVRLAWALVDGRIERVSRYAHLAPAARPAATCPACGGAVTLKLGDQRMHHAAHQPGVRCPLEAGETALHFNAKCSLWAALSAAAAAEARLEARLRCPDRTRDPATRRVARCAATHCVTLATGWDRVELEVAVGARRPDLTLWRDGQPVAAVEVVVSHAVDGRKAAALAALGIPWVEVRATTGDGGRPTASSWTPADPLPARQAARLFPVEAIRHE